MRERISHSWHKAIEDIMSFYSVKSESESVRLPRVDSGHEDFHTIKICTSDINYLIKIKRNLSASTRITSENTQVFSTYILTPNCVISESYQTEHAQLSQMCN